MEGREDTISNLNGKHINKAFIDDGFLDFHMSDGSFYRMGHDQDWCESVSLEETDLSDLQDSDVINAYESNSFEGKTEEDNIQHLMEVMGEKEERDLDGVEEWTFYRIQTNKGVVVLRWYGVSNGYYSTSVQINKIK